MTKTYLIIADGEKVGYIDLYPDEVKILTDNGIILQEV